MRNMIPYQPSNLLDEFQSELNRIFGGDGSGVVTSQWTPAVDIKERGDRYVLYADIPGVDPKQIEVTVENGVVTIRGERSMPLEEKDERWSHLERRHGSFYRRFTLPDGTDPERVEARGHNGVLEVVIPKAERALARRIAVES